MALASATDHHRTTAGGVKLYIAHRTVSPKSFGAAGDAVADDEEPVQAWAAYMRSKAFEPTISGAVDGEFLVSSPVDMRGVFRPIVGNGRFTTGFIQSTDNIPIAYIGGLQDGTFPNNGWNGTDLYFRYATPQPAANTGAHAVVVEYFRYSCLRNFHIYGAYSGFAALGAAGDAFPNYTPLDDNVCFSSQITGGRISRCSHRYFQISSGSAVGNTGNVIFDIYMSGNRSDVASATCEMPLLLERMSENLVAQVNAEWMKVKRLAAFSRCAGVVDGFHAEGISASDEGLGMFNFIGSQMSLSGITLKTVNFSGGDPETKTAGALNNSALFELGPEDQGGASRVVVINGRSQNCVAANSNMRVARTTDRWAGRLTLEVLAWEDTDEILIDAATARPKTDFATSPGTITGVTLANPVQLTVVDHGATGGEEVLITGVSGATELNGVRAKLTRIDNDTVSLQDLNGDDIDGTAFTAWTSGGNLVPKAARMPILNRWNDIFFRPGLRAKNDPGLGSAGLVNWTVIDDTQHGFCDVSKRYFVDEAGDYIVSANVEMASADRFELQVYNPNGVERTAFRRRVGCSSAAGTYYAQVSDIVELKPGESVAIYANGATTGSAYSLLNVRKAC